jgi:hypothetical protein
MKGVAILTVCLCLLCPQVCADEVAESYAFDVSALEPEPFAVNGYLEFRPSYLWLDREGALYTIGFFDQDEVRRRPRWLTRLQLEGSYQRDAVAVHVRGNSDLMREGGRWTDLTSLHEAYVHWAPDRTSSFEVGKKVMRWGTGYSWNPVGFVERPKDPDEPDLPREGFFLASAERVFSLPGALQTVAASLVIIPVAGDLSSDFGDESGLNVAGKVYLLYRDTDVDFMALAGPSQPTRYGLDFARNIQTNFEVHGEYSYTAMEDRWRVTTDGEVVATRGRAHRLLLGARYLTANDITYIVEYQHNGNGLSESEVDDLYRFIEKADALYQDTGDASLLLLARTLNQEVFSSRPLGRQYLYVRVSQKEPRDILYLTPAVTIQCNLEDRSFSVAPEAMHTGYNNWELRARLFLLFGGEETEFGEKASKARFDLTARRFF